MKIKFWFNVIAAFVICFALSIYNFLPWWFFIFGNIFLVFILKPKKQVSIWANFGGVFLCWICWAAFKDSDNSGLLSKKISQIFYKSTNTQLLYIITGIIGGIIGGLAGLTGYYLRCWIDENKSTILE